MKIRTSRVCTEHGERIRQGDIFRNVEYFEGITEAEGDIEILRIVFPVAVVLTQDCDLREDHCIRTEGRNTQDKCLMSVLMAPLYNAEQFLIGQHLSALDINCAAVNGSTATDFLKSNQRPRYHYLRFPDRVPLTDCVIDFKHYFSCPVRYLTERRESSFLCKLEELDREDISQRFASFLSRIGLPDPPASDTAELT